jgi:hypothetical protein
MVFGSMEEIEVKPIKKNGYYDQKDMFRFWTEDGYSASAPRTCQRM